VTQPLHPVSSNTEKADTYQALTQRCKQAMDQAFYLEAIFILYAMLEDRLSAFLFYAGVLEKTRTKLTKNKAVIPLLAEIIPSDDAKKHTIRKISLKVNLVRRLCQWASTSPAFADTTNYPAQLAAQLQRTARIDELPDLLTDVETWCQTRNVLVHALLNQSLEGQAETTQALAEQGYLHFRRLDAIVRSLRVRNQIRKSFNIQ